MAQSVSGPGEHRSLRPFLLAVAAAGVVAVLATPSAQTARSKIAPSDPLMAPAYAEFGKWVKLQTAAKNALAQAAYVIPPMDPLDFVGGPAGFAVPDLALVLAGAWELNARPEHVATLYAKGGPWDPGRAQVVNAPAEERQNGARTTFFYVFHARISGSAEPTAGASRALALTARPPFGALASGAGPAGLARLAALQMGRELKEEPPCEGAEFDFTLLDSGRDPAAPARGEGDPLAGANAAYALQENSPLELHSLRWNGSQGRWGRVPTDAFAIVEGSFIALVVPYYEITQRTLVGFAVSSVCFKERRVESGLIVAYAWPDFGVLVPMPDGIANLPQVFAPQGILNPDAQFTPVEAPATRPRPTPIPPATPTPPPTPTPAPSPSPAPTPAPTSSPPPPTSQPTPAPQATSAPTPIPTSATAVPSASPGVALGPIATPGPTPGPPSAPGGIPDVVFVGAGGLGALLLLGGGLLLLRRRPGGGPGEGSEILFAAVDPCAELLAELEAAQSACEEAQARAREAAEAAAEAEARRGRAERDARTAEGEAKRLAQEAQQATELRNQAERELEQEQTGAAGPGSDYVAEPLPGGGERLRIDEYDRRLREEAFADAEAQYRADLTAAGGDEAAQAAARSAHLARLAPLGDPEHIHELRRKARENKEQRVERAKQKLDQPIADEQRARDAADKAAEAAKAAGDAAAAAAEVAKAAAEAAKAAQQSADEICARVKGAQDAYDACRKEQEEPPEPPPPAPPAGGGPPAPGGQPPTPGGQPPAPAPPGGGQPPVPGGQPPGGQPPGGGTPPPTGGAGGGGTPPPPGGEDPHGQECEDGEERWEWVDEEETFTVPLSEKVAILCSPPLRALEQQLAAYGGDGMPIESFVRLYDEGIRILFASIPIASAAGNISFDVKFEFTTVQEWRRCRQQWMCVDGRWQKGIRDLAFTKPSRQIPHEFATGKPATLQDIVRAYQDAKRTADAALAAKKELGLKRLSCASG